MAATLTLREAAEELGVHYMTAYRYVRLGLLPAVKAGAEWQVARADLAEFRKPAQTSQRAGARWDRRLEARLLGGDLVGSWAVVEAALAGGIELADLYDRAITPALRSIGEKWQRGEVSIADEHRASAIAQRVLGRLSHRMVRRGRSRGTLVVGTAPGERHGLPVQIVADRLRLGGWDVIDLGCDLPAESFVESVAAAGPVSAIIVSCTSVGNEDNVRMTIDALRNAHPDTPLYVGGGAIATEGEARDLGATHWAASVPTLLNDLRAVDHHPAS